MRLDWIFLPRENPCAKFYMLIIMNNIFPNTSRINVNFYRIVSFPVWLHAKCSKMFNLKKKE